MNSSQGYILLLGQQSGDQQEAPACLAQSQWPVFVAQSAEQAVAQVQATTPYLIILSGSHQPWSQAVARRLRATVKTASMVIVALSDTQSPDWFFQNEPSELDGLLVTPLSNDILTSLVESAVAKGGL